MNPLQSQVYGLSLAIATALGCVAYEKIVQRCSFSFILLMALAFYGPALAILTIVSGQDLRNDLRQMDRALWGWVALYIAAWVTTPLWYHITRHQGVMAGSIYEIKYVVMLAAIYWLIGSRPMSVNLLAGLGLALLSIWFVSKS